MKSVPFPLKILSVGETFILSNLLASDPAIVLVSTVQIFNPPTVPLYLKSPFLLTLESTSSLVPLCPDVPLAQDITFPYAPVYPVACPDAPVVCC